MVPFLIGVFFGAAVVGFVWVAVESSKEDHIDNWDGP